jgi:transposase
MWKDEIVEEVRRNRDAYAARFNYDLNTIYQDLKAKERRSKRKLVSFSPKQPLKPAAKTLRKIVDV